MASEITSIQRRTTLQTLREKYVKIELLNFEYLVVNSLEGKAIDGSISIDATSDIRRTCNLSFVLDNSSFNCFFFNTCAFTCFIQTNSFFL